MALRHYFDLVCPYSYIMGFKVEAAEDDGVLEVEWLPLELRPAGVPTVTTRTEVLYDGAAEPDRLRSLLAGWQDAVGFEGDTRNVYTQVSLQVRHKRRGRPRSASVRGRRVPSDPRSGGRT